MRYPHGFQVWGMTPKRTRRMLFGGINEDGELKTVLNIDQPSPSA
jgi:hypothetical protein